MSAVIALERTALDLLDPCPPVRTPPGEPARAGSVLAVPGRFRLPPELEAGEPPEARGLTRDAVRLMVSWRADDQIAHAHFHDLPCFLDPGDLLVINTSGTLNASLSVAGDDGASLDLHLSTRLPGGLWLVELRTLLEAGAEAYYGAHTGQRFDLPEGGSVRLLGPYRQSEYGVEPGRPRLWLADLRLPHPVPVYLARYGSPILYRHVRAHWPSQYYQTVYVTEPGSAEMPSAGRPFTPELIARLVARGVVVAPLILHAGVSSLEEDELPHEEYYRVPATTAAQVNLAHSQGHRVIAVGTTVLRALETVTGSDRSTHAGQGWTSLVVTPDYRPRAVDGLVTGFHEPRSSHLAILEALAGRQHLAAAYGEALEKRYLWHEFGDSHLIL